MKKEVKNLLTIVIVVILGAGVATIIYKNSKPQITGANKSTETHLGTLDTGSNDDPTNAGIVPELVRSDSYSLGPAMARVSVVEFLDPECESCKAFFPIMKRVLKEYEGRIHFVVRYMGFHKSSAMAVAATESAGLQGKYWEMQEILFEKAEEWGHLPAPEESYFLSYAKILGMDIEKFRSDLVDPRWQIKLDRDMEDGKGLGVTGTPTIFINGNKLQDLSYESLVFEIDKDLAQ